MRPSAPVSLALGIMALVLLPTPSSAQSPANQHLKIQNRGSEPVTVRILHSDGQLQKQETVKPGDTHRFIFDWCATCCGHDKQRQFEVKTGSTLRATGSLYMATKKIPIGPEGQTTCEETNQMTVKDENWHDTWEFLEDYENGHRTAILTVIGTGTAP